ncbi:hypothetical protein HYU95_00895 [Candidatus Daviesbacteria bacterium]|nr:hypothetical protein [Candidatus Daviesbacteria bacterium]
MRKYLILIVCLLVTLVVSAYLLLTPKKPATPLLNPSTIFEQKQVKKVLPSETLIEYTDPSGFSFSYPDNLSIVSREITDNNTYADIQLFSKEVSGSLSLKITDSKFKTLDEWLKKNISAGTTSKDVKLGTLSAKEIILSDRLLLGALDQGISFNIEMPRVEEDFWMNVYNKILSDFSFAAPESAASQAAANTPSSDIVFEGEEVVE